MRIADDVILDDQIIVLKTFSISNINVFLSTDRVRIIGYQGMTLSKSIPHNLIIYQFILKHKGVVASNHIRFKTHEILLLFLNDIIRAGIEIKQDCRIVNNFV